jgi:tartrate/fumarate subfamily iron-sulfur-dependent hydro-lyase beta chain
VASWKPGDTLLLNGKLLTGRDAAHKRIQDMLAKGEKLPVDFTNRVIYYVGPVDPVRDEVVGPAGPTTATRMDKFTEMMLEKTGLIAMVGKAERGPWPSRRSAKHKSGLPDGRGRRRLPGGQGHQGRQVVAFADLGMEAIYEFDVQRHAGDGGGRRQRQQRAPERPARVAGAHRQDPGHRGLILSAAWRCWSSAPTCWCAERRAWRCRWACRRWWSA